jgi:mercuric ion binding protein
MKHFSFLTSFLVVLIMSVCSTAFGGDKIEVMVKGMVCSFCSQGITKKFKEQPAVKTVNVSLETHLVSLELNDKMKLEDKFIETVLKDSGYGVEKITRKQ